MSIVYLRLAFYIMDMCYKSKIYPFMCRSCDPLIKNYINVCMDREA